MTLDLGVSNSNPLKGRIGINKCLAGRRLRKKWLHGPHLLSNTAKMPTSFIKILALFEFGELRGLQETLLAGYMRPVGRVFETPTLDDVKDCDEILKNKSISPKRQKCLECRLLAFGHFR
jgi:hypothetical protein